jgi:hypothetical protein
MEASADIDTEEPGTRSVSPDPELWIKLYVASGVPTPRVVPSPLARTWLPPNAHHCTPLLAANQLGWSVLSPAPIEAVWDGGPTASGVTFRKGLTRREPGFAVTSWFGRGTISLTLGLHLRTAPDVDLLVKDVPNAWKDGARVLEGLVETDWFDGTFLITIKLTRPGLAVSWEKDEPLCQLVPYPRGWVEQFHPNVVRSGEDHTAYFAAVDRWEADREAATQAKLRGEHQDWDRQYLLGRRHDDRSGPASHRRRVKLPSFPGVEAGPREY